MWKSFEIFVFYQVAYEENYFDYMDRDVEKAKRHIKAAFVHTQAAFCDKSLGTKVHIDVQNANDPIFMEGERHTICFGCGLMGKFQERTKEIMAKEEDGTDLLVYVMVGGGGIAYLGALCAGAGIRYSVNGFDRSPMGSAGILRYVLKDQFVFIPW